MAVRESLESKLNLIYKQHGLQTFLEVCSNLLKVDSHGDTDKKKRSNGAVCEIVLCTLTRHYLARRMVTGSVFHSVVLKDKQKPTSNFRTELDFVMMAPTVCLTCECKSFVGDITITGDCALKRENLVADVSRQSLLHGHCLEQYLQQYVLPGKGVSTPPYRMFCFLYCKGTVLDKRSAAQQAKLPVLTLANLFKYYDQIYNAYRLEVYNVRQANRDFKEGAESAQLHKEHREFLGY